MTDSENKLTLDQVIHIHELYSKKEHFYIAIITSYITIIGITKFNVGEIFSQKPDLSTTVSTALVFLGLYLLLYMWSESATRYTYFLNKCNLSEHQKAILEIPSSQLRILNMGIKYSAFMYNILVLVSIWIFYADIIRIIIQKHNTLKYIKSSGILILAVLSSYCFYKLSWLENKVNAQ